MILIVYAFIFKAIVHVSTTHDPKLIDKITATNFSYLLPFIGVAAFSIEGIGLVLPLRKDFIEHNTQKNFKKVYFSVFGVILFTYLLFGTMNYLKFFEETKTIVFYNYTSRNWFIFGLEIFYSFVF